MNKNTCTNIKLNKGEMNIYDFGNIKLHAYKTNDFIDDEVFILEKNGKLYTKIKIDEINNLGVVKIRLRSMLAAIN